MWRCALAVLALALANGGCSKDPVLSADVDLAADPAKSSAPSASAASPPVFSGPSLIQQVVAGFPECVVDRRARPERIAGCKERGEMTCWRDTQRRRSIFDENDARTNIQASIIACLRPALLPSSVVWVKFGILPSGRICAPSLLSTEALLPQSLACAARRLHAYRSAVADTGSALAFQLVPGVGGRE